MKEINKIELGDKIRMLRETAGETQSDLFDILNYTNHQQVSFIERGERKASLDQIVALAQHFNVSTDYLLGLSDAPTADKDLQFICDYTGLSLQSIALLRQTKHSTIYSSRSDTVLKVVDVLIKNIGSALFEDIASLGVCVSDETEKLPKVIEAISQLIQKMNDFNSNSYDEWLAFENKTLEEYANIISVIEKIEVYKNSYFFSIENNFIDVIKKSICLEYEKYIEALDNFEKEKHKFNALHFDKMIERDSDNE